MSRVAEVIRGYRKFQGLTQTQLAQQIGTSTGAVSNWENDYRKPDMRNIIVLIQKTKISADELLNAFTYDSKKR